ncbi:unnamed protein product [Owenia fusiformis]|uniref:Uncharacterized protein n=1 Tax=Owenia fusiformis TaxID=6347 RepID=A0A8J1XNN6_OWEFU|nr:unnamed protein product [Owenia fusiformis]
MSKIPVLIFGHSLIHWLNIYQMKCKNNLGLSLTQFDLIFRGIRGGTFEWSPKSRSRFQRKSLVAYLTDMMVKSDPRIVYLQLGGNDLDNPNFNIEKIFTAIKSFAEFIAEGYDDVKVVCVGHVFKRLKPRIGFEDYERARLALNSRISDLQGSHKKILICRNFGFMNNVSLKFDNKGIHLTDEGNRCFANNIKRELIAIRNSEYLRVFCLWLNLYDGFKQHATYAGLFL